MAQGSDDVSPVDVSGLNHWFGAGEARKQALFHIDLRIPPFSMENVVETFPEFLVRFRGAAAKESPQASRSPPFRCYTLLALLDCAGRQGKGPSAVQPRAATCH